MIRYLVILVITCYSLVLTCILHPLYKNTYHSNSQRAKTRSLQFRAATSGNSESAWSEWEPAQPARPCGPVGSVGCDRTNLSPQLNPLNPSQPSHLSHLPGLDIRWNLSCRHGMVHLHHWTRLSRRLRKDFDGSAWHSFRGSRHSPSRNTSQQALEARQWIRVRGVLHAITSTYFNHLNLQINNDYPLVI